jgi:type IV secretory pathway VirB4 component
MFRTMTLGSRNADDHFVFKKHDDIGAATAEDDSLFLADCFMDAGDLDHLINCKDPKRIIVGRTGAGKSALLRFSS